MPENDGVNPAAAGAGATHVKRYSPPNQRNWSHGRRKSSGDGYERGNRGNDGGRILVGSKSGSLQDIGGYNPGNYTSGENPSEKLIPLQGCCNSGVSELLNNRWAAAMSAYNNLPEDSPERPVMYRSNASPWGQRLLPQLIINQTGGTSAGTQQDFLTELRQAMKIQKP